MTPLTIIFVQKEIGNGNVAQLDAALESARLHSPNSRVVAITDEPHLYAHICESFCINEYWDLADSYRPMYRHESQLSPQFEMMAIQRWLVVWEFVRKQKIQQFFSGDADVMIFSDLEKERHRYSDCDFTLSTDGAIPDFRQAGSMFCNRATLEAFALYLFERDGHGGNDMRLWTDFSTANPQFKRGENNEVKDGARGDHHMMYEFWEFESDGIKHANLKNLESKKIQWRAGQPYCKNKSGDMIRLLWLHQWGIWKRLMQFTLQCSRDSLDVKDHYKYWACPCPVKMP